MDNAVIVALISAGSSSLVAITALLLNYCGFASIDGRFASIERRLDVIQADIREFYRLLSEHDKRISRLEDKLK
jgi:hypothetical protein